MKAVTYKPIPGWFDLSKLGLPKNKFETYRQLQVLGENFQKTLQYQREHNSIQLEQIKELCAEMNLDLIINYGALEKEAEHE
jgi:hypothetical protein